MKTADNEVTLSSYTHALQKINDIHFTHREIDILAFLVSGRSGKSIASYLSISPKTVENHTRNIMAKIECNSKESVINFCEKSSADGLLRKHYENLLNDVLFKQSLQKIAKMCRDTSLSCAIICFEKQQLQNPFIAQLERHLKLVCMTTSLKAQDSSFREQTPQDIFTLYVFPKNYLIKENIISSSLINHKALFLMPESEESADVPKEGPYFFYSNFIENKQYYKLFFTIIECMFPSEEWKQFVPQFKGNDERSQNHFISHPPATKEKNEPQSLNILKNKRFIFTVSLTIFVICISVAFYHFRSSKNQHNLIRADLSAPAESILLNRRKLMNQIDQGFKNNAQETIKVVALVGVGGAGKTTLAHQYARQENAQVIWEFNAETQESLKTSFEKLAQHLGHTEEDKKILREIQNIKQPIEKEERILSFVQEHLRLFPNWLLIYDNVEQFLDIQKHFPQDAKLWGGGKILLTTQNSNIQNNSLVNQAIPIGEISPEQKYDLFAKIINHGSSHSFSSPSYSEIAEFLKNIPPFPLDISVAAYYLKSTSIPYQKYLDNLENYNKEFTSVQENLLKEAGTYLKTRYSILTLSFDHLLKNHEDFADLVLLMSLLDSQNIPFDLLKTYKNAAVVDNFIYHLKKYSLITNEFAKLPSDKFFSVHRSTQAICFTYLNERMRLHKDDPTLKAISYVLDDYTNQIIEQENLPRIQSIAPHLVKLLSHHNILTDFTRGLIGSKLGSLYYFVNNDKYKVLVDESFRTLRTINLKTLSSAEKLRFARSLLPIGAVYTELWVDTKTQEIFEKAIKIYTKEGEKSYADLSWALAHLGNVHRKRRNYDKAQDCLEESIRLHKQYGIDKKRMARTLAYLGATYRGLGAYQQSIETLEESLALYNKYYSHNHYRVGWIFMQLGRIFNTLGSFQKAKMYYKNSLLIFQKCLPEHHINIGIILRQLGNCYSALGEYEKARDCLEQSLRIHQKHFDKKNVPMGWVVFNLAMTYKALGNNREALKLFDISLEIFGNHSNEENLAGADALRRTAKVYLETNQLDKAENFAKRSLEILQSHNHVDTYKALEILGKVYLKKFFQSHINNHQEAEKYKMQALAAFQQALKVVVRHFPAHSPHIQWIQGKISELAVKP